MIKKSEKMADTGQQPPAIQMGKGGPNTQSYDYTGTLEATVNAKSGTKNIEKKTISNSTSDQNQKKRYFKYNRFYFKENRVCN